jgi:hypothetical protein
MATAAQTIARVKTFLEDPTEKFFKMDDYVSAYNSALDEISETTEVYESSVYVKRRKHAVYADLRGSLPPTALRITSVFNPGTQLWLDPTTPRELDQSVGREWEEHTTSYTRWWFMRGFWYLGAYPAPGDDLSPLKVYYSALLPHIKRNGGLGDGLESSPDLPPDFSEAIENYMMYEMLADRKEVDKSLEYYRRFNLEVPTLKAIGDSRMRRDRTPKMGARR